MEVQFRILANRCKLSVLILVSIFSVMLKIEEQMNFTVRFLNFRTPENCCNLPKIQRKMANLRVFHQKDANGIANSEDSDQTLLN